MTKNFDSNKKTNLSTALFLTASNQKQSGRQTTLRRSVHQLQPPCASSHQRQSASEGTDQTETIPVDRSGEYRIPLESFQALKFSFGFKFLKKNFTMIN